MSNLFKIDKVGDIYIQQGELSKRNETTIEQFSRELELEYIEMLVLSAIVASYQRDNHQSFRSLIKLFPAEEFGYGMDEILTKLKQLDYVEKSNSGNTRKGDLYPTQNLLGYLSTGNQSFILTSKLTPVELLINICMDLFVEKGARNFSNPISILLAYSENPLIRWLSRISPDVNEQCVVLLTLGYQLQNNKPMPLEDALNILSDQPLRKKQLELLWKQKDALLFNPKTIQRNSINSKEIELTPFFLKKWIPGYLIQNKEQEEINSQFCRVYTPSSISKVKLIYNSEFEKEMNRILDNLSDSGYGAYTSRLEQQNLPNNLSVMLYGKPGTGKTELVRQMARLTGRHLIIIDLSKVKNFFWGESEKNISRIFNDIQNMKKQLLKEPIVLFNEADGFFHQRGAGSSNMGSTEIAITTLFLNELEQFEGIVFATSNHTQTMDEAFERRWTIKLEVPHPDARVRTQILYKKLKGMVSFRAADILANKYNFSPAQIDNVKKKLLLLDQEHINTDLIEKYLIQEISGWNGERKSIGFNTK